MNRLFRICPKNRLVIEWKADLPDARWGFYKVNDSPSDAKRALSAICGQVTEDDEQMSLLEAS